MPRSLSPTLSILYTENDNNVRFLWPVPPELTPIQDTKVEGNIILTLPSARKAEHLVVEMVSNDVDFIERQLLKRMSTAQVGSQRFRYRGKERKLETFRRRIIVDINESVMSPGQHTFAFSIPVPANVSPSTCDFGSTDYVVYARIPGLGHSGGTLEASRKVALFVNHSGQVDGLPPAHYSESQFVHPRLGPTKIEYASKHFMIGGFLRFYSELPSSSITLLRKGYNSHMPSHHTSCQNCGRKTGTRSDDPDLPSPGCSQSIRKTRDAYSALYLVRRYRVAHRAH